MTDSQSSQLEWALRYAHLGWHVFPVNREKEPLTPNGFKDATTDDATIRAWWKRSPQAGIGVATGSVSGIVVLDVDANKPGAEDALRTLIRDRGKIPEDVVARTGGGGYHFYFKHPNNGTAVTNAQRLFGLTGIDLRGDGGYVVAPPSPHKSGNAYEWGTGQSPFDNPPGPCPEYLYRDRQRSTTSFSFSDEIPEGQRNATLASIGGLLRSLGFNQDELTSLLLAQNQRRCIPPLPESEVENIAKHIAKYPARPNLGPGQTTGNVALDELLRCEHSDTGFARVIELCHAGRLRFNHSSGRWMLWQNHWWEPDEKETIVQKVDEAVQLYRQSIQQLLVAGDEQHREALKWVRQMGSMQKVDSALRKLRSSPSIASVETEWHLQPHLLGVVNGILDLRSGVLREGFPQDFIYNHVSVVYDPKSQCPLWHSFLDDVFDHDTEVIDFVRRAVGYSLTGETKEQCLFLLVGNGSNGKSKFLSIIHAIVGRYGTVSPFSTFIRNYLSTAGPSNDLAALAGKRFVVASETNEGVVLDEARLKSMTSGEVIAARFLHREYFQFRPICKIWLGVNYPPRIVDDSDGFWRRVRRIDFPIKFSNPGDPDYRPGAKPRDKDIEDRLRVELPGILAWGVSGAVDWYREGWKLPESVRSSIATYREDSDPLHDFFAQCCIVEESQSCDCDQLFSAYSTYAQQKMLKNFEILSSSRFHGRIIRFYSRSSLDGQRRYQGVGLKPEIIRQSQSENAPIVVRSVTSSKQ